MRKKKRRTSDWETKTAAAFCVLLFVFTADAVGQPEKKKPGPLTLIPLIRLELSQHLNLFSSRDRLATDGFKLVAGNEALSLVYSNQPPPVLDHLQFPTLPFGYRLAALSLKRRWGALTTFRTTGYGAGIPPARFAQKVSGLVVEVPKAPHATQLSGYFLHAAYSEAGSKAGQSDPLPGGSQAGLEVARELKRDYRLQAEWSYSRRDRLHGTAPGRRNALFVTITGRNPLLESGLTLRIRGAEFETPAASVRGQASRMMAMTLQRKLKLHQFAYTGQLDSRQQAAYSGRAVAGQHLESLRWTFSPKFWPSFSAGKTWISQNGPGRFETESIASFSASKTARPMTLTLAYLQRSRANALTAGRLWEKESVIGGGSLALTQKQTLEVQYERCRWAPNASRAPLTTRDLRFNTRFSAWGDKMAFAPVLTYQAQQQGDNPAKRLLLVFALSAQIKLPRRLPGTDLLVRLTAHHSNFQPGHSAADLVVRWNFRKS